MFEFLKPKAKAPSITPEYAKEIATAYKTALNDDNRVNVVITNPLDETIEKQFSGATPEEIVTLYNFLQIRMESMTASMEEYKEYFNQTVQLADEQAEQGLEEEHVNAMKVAAEQLLKERELSYKRLSNVVKKLEKLVNMVSDYSEKINPEELKRW